MESGSKTRLKGMVYIRILMGINIRGLGWKIFRVAEGKSCWQMDLNM